MASWRPDLTSRYSCEVTCEMRQYGQRLQMIDPLEAYLRREEAIAYGHPAMSYERSIAKEARL